MKMTEMPSYIIENPKFEPYKPKKRHYYSSSMLSILLSIFSYILIFYVFEVSPTSIFNNTKVLFFISNTLILIIAADYGSFTNKENHGVYAEYTMRSRTDNYYPVPVMSREIPRDEEIKNIKYVEIKKPKEKEEPIVKEMVCVSSPNEKVLRVVSEEKPINDLAIEEYKPVTDQTVARGKASDARKNVNPKAYGRSKSDKQRKVKITGDTKAKRKSYRRSESDRSKRMVVIPDKWENVKEESEEFSKMSTEEVNRKVEEFIQRFNRDIRLQSST